MNSDLSSPALDLATLQRSLDEMRVFVTRRFDEISFEINATGQMLGMTEDAMTTRFTEVLAMLNAVAFKGDGKTPHNIGVELDAVVKTTEDAANRILDSATLIADLTKHELDWADPAARAGWLQTINQHTDDILSACAFQDLTGQRIACTLENIRKAESDLSDTLRRMGIKLDQAPSRTAEIVGADVPHAQSQADIDALFA
jgi:chemotaxis protein CheZ